MARLFGPQALSAFLIVLGVVLLLSTVGVIAVSVGDIVVILLAVLLIVAGLSLVFRSRRRFSGRSRSFVFGELSLDSEAWDINDSDFEMGIGEMRIDLARANVPDGQHRLTCRGFIGGIKIQAPPDIGLDATGQIGLGDLDILGHKSEGLSRKLSLASTNYATATRRVVVEAELLLGEISINYKH